MFASVRKIAIAVIGASIIALAFVGVLSVWEVLGSDQVYKALTSMALIVFSGASVILVALEREGKLSNLIARKGGTWSLSRHIIWAVIILFIAYWIIDELFWYF